MKITIISCIFVLAFGIFLILCDILQVPTMASTRAALSIAQHGRRHTHRFSAIQFRMASLLSKHLHLNEYRRRKLEATLRNAEISLTPETYTAQAFVAAALRMLLAIPAYYVFPILTPLIILKAVNLFLKKLHAADDLVQKKREEIESKLPGFTATIAQELTTSHDVLAMLEGYRQSAGPVFGRELEITVADMHSGSQAGALAHLDSRVNSRMLNDVVRGLQSALRGDNSETYFNILSENFKSIELQNLEKASMKRPGKISFYSYLLFGCLFLMYAFIIIYQLFSSGSILFK